ncbi:MAG: phosphomannomutase/phosphoglucomutase [Verrucomicrobia bacterium]|nr:MAG: phosphomannomutase/phosphoglucomutase [Verrucomicrobiota bacterium]
MSSPANGSIFKAYDIRGVYGQTLTDDLAFKIGRAFATFLKPRKVVVGRDMRPHSLPLFRELARGLTLHGVAVVDLGLCSTPMCYFADGNLGADGGVMITASHNPGEWNGFKLCREQAIPISGATGIKEIEKIVLAGQFAAPAATPGKITSYDVVPNYVARIRRYAEIRRPLRVCVDFANSMGILENKVLEGLVEIEPLFDTLDGTFPNHEANPLKHDTLEAIQQKMRAGKYDFGIAYDGDADRAGFLDERGEIIPMDIITALIAKAFLAKQKGNVFYDLRSSWAVKEVIAENGGAPLMSRVGHAFIKAQMREANAIFAGELSGHYYFRENYFAESSSLAALSIANLVSAGNVPLSALVKPIQRYFASGEINSEVHDPQKVLATLRQKYTGGKVTELDGLSLEFSDWWFNVRSSNTEPLVRLNLEAKTRAMMEQKRDELLALIRA